MLKDIRCEVIITVRCVDALETSETEDIFHAPRLVMKRTLPLSFRPRIGEKIVVHADTYLITGIAHDLDHRQLRVEADNFDFVLCEDTTAQAVYVLIKECERLKQLGWSYLYGLGKHLER